MNDIVREHRKTALDGMYSNERRQAIERLADVYDDADRESRRRIAETLGEVARESTYADERELARDKLEVLFDRDPSGIASTVVRTYCRLATDARHGDERIAAIDALARLVRAGLDEELVAYVEETLVEVASTATRERERERARDRLADLLATAERSPSTAVADATGVEDLDVAAAAAGGAAGAGDEESMTAYLAASIAEHLETAAQESPEECLGRAEELRDFVANHEVADGAYDEVLDELDDTVEQLSVHPGGDLDEQRRTQVRQVSERVRRLYLRETGGD